MLNDIISFSRYKRLVSLLLSIILSTLVAAGVHAHSDDDTKCAEISTNCINKEQSQAHNRNIMRQYHTKPELNIKQSSVYGPEQFRHRFADSVAEYDIFDVTSTTGSYRIKVSRDNATSRNGAEPLSSVIILLNGVEVVAATDLKQNVNIIEKSVSLLRKNEMAVKVIGEQHSAIMVEIVAVEKVPPTISVTSKPRPAVSDNLNNLNEGLIPINILLLGH